MGSVMYEVEVTIDSGKNLKNVNWRYGDLRPYVVAWVDSSSKVTTKVDVDNDDDPIWDEKLVAPIRGYDRDSALDEAVLHFDVVHAKNDEEEDVKPLVGSTKVHLREIVDEGGLGGKVIRTLKVKRPSGRPHGKIEIKVCVREPARYYDHPPPAQYGVPYGAPPPYGGHYYESSREYSQPPPVGYPYGAAPPAHGGYDPYGAPAPPQTGYPYGGPPPQSGYPYGGPPPQYSSYGGEQHTEEKKKSKFGGMGTGLAIGAGVGLVGGIALAEGYDHLKDEIAEEAAENVEESLGYDDDE